MTWLTWRQFRGQAAVVYALVGALLLTLAIVQLPDADSASAFMSALGFDGTGTTVYYIGFFAVLAVPAIVGVFWGAPLVARELETGTHRLVWNQTVTRNRWLATKVAAVGLAAVAGTALLSLLVTWWCGPIDDALNSGELGAGLLEQSRMEPPVFSARGIAPIGYAAFAFALGVTAGMVIRRTVPAMAITLAVFVAVQIAVPTLVRPQLAPLATTTAITADNLRGLMIAEVTPDGVPTGPVTDLHVGLELPGAWILANETLDAEGRVVDLLPNWVIQCGPRSGPGSSGDPTCFERLAAEGYQQRVTYQPASRYWALQAYELAGFTALALALFGFCFWWIRRLS